MTVAFATESAVISDIYLLQWISCCHLNCCGCCGLFMTVAFVLPLKLPWPGLFVAQLSLKRN